MPVLEKRTKEGPEKSGAIVSNGTIGRRLLNVEEAAQYLGLSVDNHDDALEYEDRMKEYADEEENREQYEFPDVEKALPDCIQRTLKAEYRSRLAEARRLLSIHRNGKYRSWLLHLHKIERLSR